MSTKPLRDEIGEYYSKDPGSTLDFVFRWTAWLVDVTDTISVAPTIAIAPTSELALSNQEHTPEGEVTVWLSGGVSGREYNVACRINTVGGRSDERTMRIKVQQR